MYKTVIKKNEKTIKKQLKDIILSRITEECFCD